MNRCCADRKRRLDEGILVAEARLSREDCQVDAFFLLEETSIVFTVMLLSSLEVFLGLRLVALDLVNLATDQPKLSSILLRNGIKHVVQYIKCLLVIFLTQS